MKRLSKPCLVGESIGQPSLKTEVLSYSVDQLKNDLRLQMERWIEKYLSTVNIQDGATHTVRMHLEAVRREKESITPDAKTLHLIEHIDKATCFPLSLPPAALSVLSLLISHSGKQPTSFTDIVKYTKYKPSTVEASLTKILQRFATEDLRAFWKIEGDNRKGWSFITLQEFNPDHDSYRMRMNRVLQDGSLEKAPGETASE